MKYRQGFISNSSSSSFVVYKKDITEQQADYIRRHQEISNMDPFPVIIDNRGITIYEDNNIIIIKKNEIEYEVEHYERYDSQNICGKYDNWSISEDEDTIEGCTTMDNFDMHYFLQRIGVTKAIFRE
jgi:hypothetical protein